MLRCREHVRRAAAATLAVGVGRHEADESVFEQAVDEGGHLFKEVAGAVPDTGGVHLEQDALLGQFLCSFGFFGQADIALAMGEHGLEAFIQDRW